MFGALYTRAIELFGTSLLIVAMMPLLAVFTAVALTIDPGWLIGLLEAWIGKEISVKAWEALFVLAGLYLLAFILYGLRDRITLFISGGHFWIAGSIHQMRRRRFLTVRLRSDSVKREREAIPQATTWAEFGFPDADPDDVFIPVDFSQAAGARRATKLMSRIQRALRDKKLSQDLVVAWVDPLNELLVLLHRLSIVAPADTKPLIARLKKVTSDHTIDIKEWCDSLQNLTYGELSDAAQKDLWTPDSRHVQPTSLGNVLVWASIYTTKRYGIEMDFLFPRLIAVVGERYERYLDDHKTFLDFSVLMTFLTAVGAIVASAFQLPMIALELSRELMRARDLWYANVSPVPPVATLTELTRSLLLPSSVVVFWCCAVYVTYSLAVAAARGYVAAITSAADLYRLDLLEHLKLGTPKNAEAEKSLWTMLNESIATGEWTDVSAEEDPLKQPMDKAREEEESQGPEPSS